MEKEVSIGFRGFSRDSLNFLHELGMNNSKTWFEANRSKYEDLYEEFTRFVLSLNDAMSKIDPDFEMRPSKVISRIYRDLRFSRDKTPFRTCTWITYKRPRIDMNESPVFFFELSPEQYRYGMGFYAATKRTLDSYREGIKKDPEYFSEMVRIIEKNRFAPEGEMYKKRIENDLPEKLQKWFQRRNLYIIRNCPIDDDLFSPKISKRIQKEFEILSPFYNFLWSIKGEK